MPDYTLAEFQSRAGADFAVDGVEGALRLERVLELPMSRREGGGFRLEFDGPAQPVLPQATYSLSHDGEAFEIFIVPVSKSAAGGITYEAIFT